MKYKKWERFWEGLSLERRLKLRVVGEWLFCILLIGFAVGAYPIWREMWFMLPLVFLGVSVAMTRALAIAYRCVLDWSGFVAEYQRGLEEAGKVGYEL